MAGVRHLQLPRPPSQPCRGPPAHKRTVVIPHGSCPLPSTVNGVAFHPALPLLATASGQRRYFLAPTDSSSDSDSEAAGGSGSSSSDGSEDEGHAAAAVAGSGSLSADENLLAVWCCAARPLQVPADAAPADGSADAAAEAKAAAAAEAADADAAAGDAMEA